MTQFIALACIGLLIHICKKGVEVRSDGFSLSKYIAANPWQSALSPLGTIALFLFLLEFELLNSASAFMAGYVGNSAADVIGKRANL